MNKELAIGFVVAAGAILAIACRAAMRHAAKTVPTAPGPSGGSALEVLKNLQKFFATTVAEANTNRQVGTELYYVDLLHNLGTLRITRKDSGQLVLSVSCKLETVGSEFLLIFAGESARSYPNTEVGRHDLINAVRRKLGVAGQAAPPVVRRAMAATAAG